MDLKKTIREGYAEVARSASNCCESGSPGNSGASNAIYDQSQIDAVPPAANMGLGCGNPTAVANLQPGDIVLDLGCGGGFDCFLAAKVVGPTGRVIGVDMTPEMIEKAQENATEGGL